MIGTTLPTPMYALYGEQMHFAVLTTTVIYATYAGGVLFALLVFGRWSDAIGRRPLLLAGVAFALASAVVFLLADSVPMLLIGRVLSGLSAGVFTGTATAAVIEAAPPAWRTNAAAVATIANVGGLGRRARAGRPARAVRAAPAASELRRAHRAGAAGRSSRCSSPPRRRSAPARIGVQRLSMPAEVRSVFVIAGLAAFAGFAVTGLFMAVAPSFVAEVVGIDNHALAGLVAGSIFARRRWHKSAPEASNRSARSRSAAACWSSAMAILVVALYFSSLAGLVVAAARRRRRPWHDLQPRAGRGRRAHTGAIAAPRSVPPTSSSPTWPSRCPSSAKGWPPAHGDCAPPG